MNSPASGTPPSKCSVIEDEQTNAEVIPFAVHLSLSDFMDNPDENDARKDQTISHPLLIFLDKGIVGTILLLNRKSVYVWFAWGEPMVSPPSADSTISSERTKHSAGKGSDLEMGPLMIGMPRTIYQGAFSGALEASVSKLVGSADEEEETLARNIASRLSKKLGISVMLSCSLKGCPASAEEGLEASIVQARAAAQAEREILDILTKKLTASE